MGRQLQRRDSELTVSPSCLSQACLCSRPVPQLASPANISIPVPCTGRSCKPCRPMQLRLQTTAWRSAHCSCSLTRQSRTGISCSRCALSSMHWGNLAWECTSTRLRTSSTSCSRWCSSTCLAVCQKFGNPALNWLCFPRQTAAEGQRCACANVSLVWREFLPLSLQLTDCPADSHHSTLCSKWRSCRSSAVWCQSCRLPCILAKLTSRSWRPSCVNNRSAFA